MLDVLLISLPRGAQRARPGQEAPDHGARRNGAAPPASVGPELDIDADLLIGQMFGALDRIRLQMSIDLMYLEQMLGELLAQLAHPGDPAGLPGPGGDAGGSRGHLQQRALERARLAPGLEHPSHLDQRRRASNALDCPSPVTRTFCARPTPVPEEPTNDQLHSPRKTRPVDPARPFSLGPRPPWPFRRRPRKPCSRTAAWSREPERRGGERPRESLRPRPKPYVTAFARCAWTCYWAARRCARPRTRRPISTAARSTWSSNGSTVINADLTEIRASYELKLETALGCGFRPRIDAPS